MQHVFLEALLLNRLEILICIDHKIYLEVPRGMEAYCHAIHEGDKVSASRHFIYLTYSLQEFCIEFYM